MTDFASTTRLICLGITILGGVLCYYPVKFQDLLAQYLYDAVSPPMVMIKPYLNQHQVTNSPGETIPSQLQNQLQILWAENTEHQLVSQQLKNSPLRNMPVVEAAPLVSPQIITANILTTQQVNRWQQDLILRSQETKKLSKGDFVISQTELLIDQGQSADISSEALVLTGSLVIGHITQVGLDTARVQRIIDPEFRGAARLLRQLPQGAVWGPMGSLHGTGETTCQLDYIKLTDPVTVGDLVVAINPETKKFLGPVYGRVTRVTQEEGKTDWQIEVTPLFQGDPLALGEVQILAEKLNTSRVLQASHVEEVQLKNIQVNEFPGSQR